jgi:hypothetical protein
MDACKDHALIHIPLGGVWLTISFLLVVWSYQGAGFRYKLSQQGLAGGKVYHASHGLNGWRALGLQVRLSRAIHGGTKKDAESV